jgi:acetoin utilization protein AcuB
LIKAGPSAATSLAVYEIRDLLSRLKVENIMEKRVITVDENEVVEEAARIMVDRNISCLPVMRGELLIGIITVTDLFKVFIDAFGARHTGLRLVLTMGERPGQLAGLTGAIAAKGGNIVSMITSPGDDFTHIRETMKVERLSADDMRTIVDGLDGMVIEDLR